MEKTSYKYELIHNTFRVSRSGYYVWIKVVPVREAREAQDRDDFEIILTIYKKRGYAKGA